MSEFNSEGRFDAKIIEAFLAEPRFDAEKKGPNAFDVALHVQTEDGREGFWFGECSGSYGMGNNSHRTWFEITLENLQNVGFEGSDLTTIEEQLLGKVIPVTVKSRDKDGKTYYDVKFIGGNAFAPKRIEAGGIASRLAALSGGAAAQKKEPAPENWS